MRQQRKLHPAIWALCAIAIVILFSLILLEPRPGGAPVSAEASPTPWTLTRANYERLQAGMTYGQVCEILGKPGTEMSRSELAGYVTVLYGWQGDGVANMNAMFQDDRLISKAQFGLE